jgi:hypothetical protein
MKNSINNTIKSYCKKNQVSISTLARKLNYTRTSMYALLNRSDMSVSTLSAISQALKHNFFQYLWVDKTMLTKEESIALRNEISNLKAEVSHLTKENSLLHKIVSDT